VSDGARVVVLSFIFVCFFLFFSILKVHRPAVADKMENLAKHPKSLETAAFNNWLLAM